MMLALVDTLRSALRTLGSNKLRSVLTLFGIIIGVAAVAAMAAIITGFRSSVTKDMAMLGTGTFQVQREPMGMGGGGENARRRWMARKKFTMADVELLQQACTRCAQVAGEAWERGPSVKGPEGVTLQGVDIVGSNSAFFTNNGYSLDYGRLLSEADVARGADAVVVGSDIVEKLFPNRNPLGQRLTIGSRVFGIVGVLERRGSTGFGSRDNLVVMPIPNWYAQFGLYESLHVSIMARDPEQMAKAQDEVVSILRRHRGVPPQAENDFEMFSNDSAQQDFDSIIGNIAVVTIGVCAIALLIAGIGVMNIMLVSVTERTSEIGVRRALGARRRRILMQFVVEAVILCALGGAMGIGLGWCIAQLFKIFVGVPTELPMWAIAMSLGAASLVGLAFGIYPAWRASRLDPVEAMRQE